METRKNEKGQILVILVVAIVVVFGFTALAIDGTMIYSERHQDQSTTDSSSLAGAGSAAQYLKTNMSGSFTCDTTTGSLYNNAAQAARTAAINSAAEDGITLLNNDISTNNGVVTTCGTDNGVPYIDVRIVISSSVETTFLQVITKDAVNTVSDSTARVYVSSAFAGGNALISLGQSCSETNGGIYALGNGQINLKSGGIYSATCLKATGSSRILSDGNPIYYGGQGATQFMVGSQVEYTGTNGLIFDGTAPVLIMVDADLTVPSGTLQFNGNTNTPTGNVPQAQWPIPTTQALPAMNIPVMTPISPPACGADTSVTIPGTGGKIYPGTYTSISWGSWNNGYLEFSPGVYCITNSLTFSGGGGTTSVKMDGVTLYFTSSATSDFSTGGDMVYSFINGTFYKTAGSFSTGHNINATGSKFYLGSGNFTLNGSAVMTMDNSSIYLNNGNFNVTAGGKLSANNITTYIKQGSFTLDGGAIVDLYAPGCSTSACGVGPAIPGVLLYMDKTNTGSLNVNNGTGTAHILNGTMYAPNAVATFDGGTSTTATDVQLIAKVIRVTNGGKLNMNLDNARLYSQGSMTIELHK